MAGFLSGRFVSKYPGYSFVAQREVSTPLGGGEKTILKRSIVCDFTQGGLSPWEVEAATKVFKHLGVASSEPPQRRLSWYDPEIQQRLKGWTDEERAMVESRLMSKVGGGDVIYVEKPRLAPPWPTYDKTRGRGQKTTAELIAERVEELGLDPDLVAAYERENQNRTDVIGALLAARPADAVVVTA